MKTALILLLFAITPTVALTEGKPLFLRGELLVKGGAEGAAFELLSEKGSYTLKVTPRGSKNSCEFAVKRLEAPHAVRGREGVMFANRPGDCRFAIQAASTKEFWDSIMLLDLSFHVVRGGKLNGSAKLSSLKAIALAEVKFE